MKVKIAARFDFNATIYKKFCRHVPKGKRTSKLEKLMKNFVMLQEGDPANIDKQINEEELRKIDAEMNKLAAEREKKIQIKEVFDQKEQAIKEEKLQKEKEKMLNQKFCIHCKKKIIDDIQFKTFPAGKVCNSCFNLHGGKEYNAWMKEPKKEK